MTERPLTFADLVFDPRPGHPMGEQAHAFFPNGYGVSVIRGPASYGGRKGLYELAVLKGADPSHLTLDYSTPVTEAMGRVQALPKAESGND